MANTRYRFFISASVILALCVILLGAYTRLSDAGLGCPDWPGCYGKLVLPNSSNELAKAQQTFPTHTIVPNKAWKEMVHRYFAGTLGLLIVVIALSATIRRRRHAQQPLLIPWLLVFIVALQATLGMWTVTLNLLPLVVMGHLLGGMIIVSLLWWLHLKSRKALPETTTKKMRNLKPWAVLAFIVVFLQVFLGAWTSTNYAALACPHFPFCHGSLIPSLEWRNAFNFTAPIGPNYEGGTLAMQARVTIQMAHRYGALLMTLYLLPFAWILISIRELASLRKIGWIILLLLSIQITLGILNIVLTLPMWTAVSHNGVAALLMLSLVTVIYKLTDPRKGALAT